MDHMEDLIWLFIYLQKILLKIKNKTFNYGNHQRDFTYVDDIVESILKVLEKPPKKKIPYNIFNIGGNRSYKLQNLFQLLKKTYLKKLK